MYAHSRRMSVRRSTGIFKRVKKASRTYTVQIIRYTSQIYEHVKVALVAIVAVVVVVVFYVQELGEITLV
jgi:hypothetical protein